MAFSFSRLIIPESDILTYEKALDLIRENNIQIKRLGTAACSAEIDTRAVWLGFNKGVPVWRCSYVYGMNKKIIEPCVHTIAVSLLWDRSRSVPDPSREDVEFLLSNFA